MLSDLILVVRFGMLCSLGRPSAGPIGFLAEAPNRVHPRGGRRGDVTERGLGGDWPAE